MITIPFCHKSKHFLARYQSNIKEKDVKASNAHLNNDRHQLKKFAKSVKNGDDGFDMFKGFREAS